ncbi:unnamed protein product [Parnassius apollo]|uniref:(apollo) hypothetical protein n=1 Tax=Parnassius apollo TaxID=110799 RepID=A0A8S3WS17_PARAO|nr:unnamed protein product [Parnassius apollo]
MRCLEEDLIIVPEVTNKTDDPLVTSQSQTMRSELLQTEASSYVDLLPSSSSIVSFPLPQRIKAYRGSSAPLSPSSDLQKEKIDQLKTVNERQRKQIYRLKYQSAKLREYEHISKNNTEDIKQSESDTIKTIKNNVEEDIITFLEEDENSPDRIVAQGNDITSLSSLMTHLKSVQGIITKSIDDSGIYEKELLIPFNLKQFAGTMKVHQAVWNANKPNQLSMRKMSCAEGECKNNSVSCEHGYHVGLYIIGEQADRLLTDRTNKNKSDKINLIKKSSQAKKGSGVSATESNKPQILSNILIQPGCSYSVDLADEFYETK